MSDINRQAAEALTVDQYNRLLMMDDESWDPEDFITDIKFLEMEGSAGRYEVTWCDHAQDQVGDIREVWVEFKDGKPLTPICL